MEKAIEIKRRAQRCILNGDLDGALREYEKLIASGDSDPYHSVLLADLLYRKGDPEGAARRYLEAVGGYESVGLVKNAIAVCKKMSRLSLSPGAVLRRLAGLHALDGLLTESSLYHMQHAELLVGLGKLHDAGQALRQAFQVCPDNVRALGRLGEIQEQGGERLVAAATLREAASHHERLGQLADAKRCQARAEQLHPEPRVETPEPAVFTPREETSGAPSGDTIPPRPTGPHAGTADLALPIEPLIETHHLPQGGAPDASLMPTGSEAGAGALDALGVPPESGATVGALDAAAVSPGSEASVGPRSGLAARGADPTSATLPPAAEAVLAVASSAPERPGFFSDPVRSHDRRAAGAAATAPASEPGAGGLPEVSVLLGEAQALFQCGERSAASATLVRAAQAYDHLGRFESAASIYRSLSQANETPLQVMMLWLKNCQRRDDIREAARVACELGDRALMEGDSAGAREWFERAHAFDGENELASRRLERLNAPGGQGAVATATPPMAPPARPAVRDPAPVESPGAAAEPPGRPAPSVARPGHVEISVVREEPVDIDLGTMIAEFQRGLEEQLEADPQGHYDLGMSYREMGLFEHAVLSFQTAARSSEFRVRASEMMGRCLLDQGDFDGAADRLRETLKLSNLSPESSVDIRYQLGLALEAGGRLVEAAEQFERIYAVEANYPDVASKIRALRKMLGKD